MRGSPSFSYRRRSGSEGRAGRPITGAAISVATNARTSRSFCPETIAGGIAPPPWSICALTRASPMWSPMSRGPTLPPFPRCRGTRRTSGRRSFRHGSGRRARPAFRRRSSGRPASRDAASRDRTPGRSRRGTARAVEPPIGRAMDARRPSESKANGRVVPVAGRQPEGREHQEQRATRERKHP